MSREKREWSAAASRASCAYLRRLEDVSCHVLCGVNCEHIYSIRQRRRGRRRRHCDIPGERDRVHTAIGRHDTMATHPAPTSLGVGDGHHKPIVGKRKEKRQRCQRVMSCHCTTSVASELSEYIGPDLQQRTDGGHEMVNRRAASFCSPITAPPLVLDAVGGLVFPFLLALFNLLQHKGRERMVRW